MESLAILPLKIFGVGALVGGLVVAAAVSAYKKIKK